MTSDYGDLIAKLKSLRNPELLTKKFSELMESEEEPWYNNTIINVYDPNGSEKFDRKFILTFTDIVDEE